MSNSPNPGRQKNPTDASEELIERLDLAERDLSAATVAYHAALAGHLGLSESEEQAVDVLLRRGPLTHAELTQETGLAKPTVSDLVDRLEKRGFAVRKPHPKDRRRVLIEANEQRIQGELEPLFAPWAQQRRALYVDYSEDQLRAIADFMARAAEVQARAAGDLGRLTTPNA